ncbi:MAG: CpsD/CapB family tyrosine-protein kinase [Phycisphaerae bacterium]
MRHLNALVVDCNLGAGQLGNRLGVRGGPGLAEVLAGECALMDAVHDSCVGNLKVLPAGMLGSNSRSELLNSRLMPRVMDEIRERFHYVLVDTPAVQAAADVGRIGALCTGVLMVVRMQRTSAALVRQSVRWLAANNVHVLGCVAVGADNRAARMQYDSSAA